MSKPNIILITTDQQRFDTIQSLGNTHIYTPHLNWLSDEGVTFERCYSDNPICMPARATIMTGRHAFNHGMITNAGIKGAMDPASTLAGVLTRNGYQTRAQGKMHFDPIRANYGFEHMELPMDYYRMMNENQGRGIPKGHGVGENEIEPVISTVDETKSAIYWTVKRSIDFIETRDETRPFFLWTSFAKPHPPFDPCYNYWALYQNKDLPRPVYGDWSADLAKAPQGYYQPTYMLNNAYRMSEEQLLDSKRAYYACITQIDYNLGLLFARLREMDLLRNTWIIFTSDHGDLMGDHHMCAKTVFLEGSAHVPMIVRPPYEDQNKKGVHCQSLVTLADVMPTILTAAGADEASASCVKPSGADEASACGMKHMDGSDLLDIAAKNGADRTFYGNSADMYFCVMEGGYKYHWTAFNGEELLFYLPDDPMEQKDLARTEREKALRMKKKLAEQVAGYNAELVENGELLVRGAVSGPLDVRKWPGFHSTVALSDVLH